MPVFDAFAGIVDTNEKLINEEGEGLEKIEKKMKVGEGEERVVKSEDESGAVRVNKDGNVPDLAKKLKKYGIVDPDMGRVMEIWLHSHKYVMANRIYVSKDPYWVDRSLDLSEYFKNVK